MSALPEPISSSVSMRGNHSFPALSSCSSNWLPEVDTDTRLTPHTLAMAQPWAHAPSQHTILEVLMTHFKKEVSFPMRIPNSTNDASLDQLGIIPERTSWKMRPTQSQEMENPGSEHTWSRSPWMAQISKQIHSFPRVSLRHFRPSFFPLQWRVMTNAASNPNLQFSRWETEAQMGIRNCSRLPSNQEQNLGTNADTSNNSLVSFPLTASKHSFGKHLDIQSWDVAYKQKPFHRSTGLLASEIYTCVLRTPEGIDHQQTMVPILLEWHPNSFLECSHARLIRPWLPRRSSHPVCYSCPRATATVAWLRALERPSLLSHHGLHTYPSPWLRRSPCAPCPAGSVSSPGLSFTVIQQVNLPSKQIPPPLTL